MLQRLRGSTLRRVVQTGGGCVGGYTGKERTSGEREGHELEKKQRKVCGEHRGEK